MHHCSWFAINAHCCHCPTQSIPIREAQQAEMALLSGNAAAAEHILLQAGLHFRAIMLHVTLYQWEQVHNPQLIKSQVQLMLLI